MSLNDRVIQKIESVLHEDGGGSAGSRNLSGTTSYHAELEKEVAELFHKDSALLFTSGYVANMATISTLAKIIPDIVFISDEKNHASIINAIKSTGCKKIVYKHSDMGDLESKLSSLSVDAPKIIIFESLYSMDGDIAPIKETCDLADKYNALTYIDEIHAVGMYGRQGSGIASLTNQLDRIDIIQGGFSKAYGLIGGFIAGAGDLVDCVRSLASGFIFTTSLPSMIVAGVIESVRHLKESESERLALHENVDYLKSKLSDLTIPFLNHQTHIVPVIIGDSDLSKQMSQYLLDHHHIYLQSVNFPSVPKGEERFRIMTTARHTKQDIHDLVEGIHHCFLKFMPHQLGQSMPKNFKSAC